MKKINVGEWKQRLMRLFQYLMMPSAIASILGFLKLYGFEWWWIFSLVPVCAFILWIDDKRIFSQEWRYMNSKNMDFQESWNDIRAIKKLLEEKK